jgi:hypothetical protein
MAEGLVQIKTRALAEIKKAAGKIPCTYGNLVRAAVRAFADLPLEKQKEYVLATWSSSRVPAIKEAKK